MGVIKGTFVLSYCTYIAVEEFPSGGVLQDKTNDNIFFTIETYYCAMLFFFILLSIYIFYS